MKPSSSKNYAYDKQASLFDDQEKKIYLSFFINVKIRNI